MAIIINSQPAERALVYNDNTWSLASSIGTLTDFRYHIRLFKSPLSATPTIHGDFYIYPRQEQLGKTYFDPKQILESLLGYDIDIPSSGHTAFFANDNSHSEYLIRIAEETRATDNQWVEQSFILTDEKSVINGGIQHRDWLDFNVADYEVSIGVTDTKFLTDGPSTRYQNSTDSSWLYFISTENGAPTHLTVKSYDATNTLLSTETLENPHSSAISGNPTLGRKHQYARVVTGREDINSTSSSYKSTINVVHADSTHYTVQLRGASGMQSELITYYLDEQCSKYETIRLHWANQWGGFDSFNFILKSREDTDIKRSQFVQQHHTWNDGDWSYTKASRGMKDYAVNYGERLILNTDHITEEEAVWLKQLFLSPEVYQEIGSDLVAVNVKRKQYTKKTTINDKLKQYDIELDYGLKEHRQRG